MAAVGDSALDGLWRQAGARVTVELDWDALEPGVAIELADGSPGGDERDAWERGAMHGVQFALDTSRALPCVVRVTEICADASCSGATVVAAAAACAVWEALEVTPPEAALQRIDARVRESRARDRHWLGRFDG